MWKKFQKFSPCGLQDIKVSIDKNNFFNPAKKRAIVLDKVTIASKNAQNVGASLDSFLKASWLHA